MNFRKLTLPVLLILTAGWFVTGCGQGEKSGETAQTAEQMEKPSVERTSEAVLSAVVEAVDYEARTFTLKDEGGNTQTLAVKNPNVPLEQLKAGDAVIMTIYQKMVNYVAAPDEATPPDAALRTVGGPMGAEDQNITVVNAQQMTTTVEAIDVENRMLTVVDAEGTPLTLPVQDDVQNLDQIKVGDKIVTQITQVISVAVDKEGSDN